MFISGVCAVLLWLVTCMFGVPICFVWSGVVNGIVAPLIFITDEINAYGLCV